MPSSSMDVDVARLADVCRRYGVRRLLLFGSVATGAATGNSDVDVLYDLDDDARLGWEIEELNDELDDIFGRHVDLVSRRYLNPRLRDRILGEARPLYAA